MKPQSEKQSEKQFETGIRNWLHSVGVYAAGTPFHRMKVPIQGWYIKVWGGGFQRAGIPDLLLCVRGKFIAAELKSATGKPTELQQKNIQMIKDGGGIAVVLYPDKLIKFMEIVMEVIKE